MQLKKITIFTLLAVVLIICSLSTISAATHNIDNTTLGGINGTINGATPGDTIILDEGIYTGNNNTNMTINKNITIQGKTKDKVILDAKGLSRIFSIGNGYNVTLINIIFTNSFVIGNGVVLNDYANSKLTLINCTINNNYINGSGSGAVFSRGNLNISDCNFINNTASQGSAIYNYGGNATITNCNFNNNTALGIGYSVMNYGGAIMDVYNSTFINNTAIMYGSGLRNQNNSTVNIYNCNFINNTGNISGGAVYNYLDANMTIHNCNFTNNNAGYGAAIYLAGGTNTLILDCIFIDNNANISGGGVYAYNRTNSTVYNCIFINNTASDYGGAIFNNGNMNVSGNIMSDNSAGLGQMIYNNGTMGILKLTYINNSTLAVLNGSTITIYATLTDDMGNTVTGQNIRIYINGILGGTLIQNIESIEGYVSFNLTVIGEDGDLFPVNGTYDGIGDCPIVINEGLISVFTIDPYNITKIATNSTISAKNTTVGKSTNITGIATDENGNILANIELSVIVDGKTYTVTTNSNGEWTLTYIPTKVGNIDVSVQWKGNTTHNGFNNKAKLNVAKRNIIVTITTEENDDGSIIIIANATYEDDGSPVINHPVDFILDGKIIGTGITNKNGIAKLKIPANKINGKTHKISVLVYGDDNSNDGKATSTFTRKTPDNPKPNNPNKTTNNSAVKTTAAMKKTGIPINLIILVLLSCLGIPIRKK